MYDRLGMNCKCDVYHYLKSASNPVVLYLGVTICHNAKTTGTVTSEPRKVNTSLSALLTYLNREKLEPQSYLTTMG